MNKIIHIIKYKLLLFLKFNSPVTLASISSGFGVLFIYILFAIGCFLFTKNSIEYLLINVKIGSFLLHRFIMIVLFLFFVTINIGNIVVSFSTLYRSTEVNYLLTKPIAFEKIFLIKFLDNFFYSSTTLLFIIFSALAGYGSFYNLGWYFYPITLLFYNTPLYVSCSFAWCYHSAGCLKTCLKMGVKTVIFFIASAYSLFIFLFYFISSPISLVEKVFQYYPNINQYFGFLESDILKVLPNYWIADALYWISQGNIFKSIPFIIFNFTASVVFFSIAIYIAKRWYYTTWLTSLTITTDFKIKLKLKNSFLSFEKTNRP